MSELRVRVNRASDNKLNETTEIEPSEIHNLLKELEERFGRNRFILSYDYGMDTDENDLSITIYDYYVE